MKNGLVKEFWREIKGSINRFISILLIVFLGVGFFVGVKAASPSMKYSADKFFRSNNLMDFKLMSEFGFQKDDIKAIESVEGVLQVRPAYTTDLMVKMGTSNNVVRIHSLPESYGDDSKIINEVNVVEGRLPEKSGECVVESSQQFDNAYSIGDVVEVESPDKDKELDTLVKKSKYTVVGLIESPQYISFDRGVSQVGNGTILYYMMILPEDFAYSRYTELYVTTTASRDNASTFSDKYKDDIDVFKSEFARIGEERLKINRDEIIAEGSKKIKEGKDKLEREKKAAEEKFKQALDEIEAGKKELSEKEEQLKEAENKLKDAETQIKAARNKLAASEREYNKAKKDYEKQISEGQKKIDDGYKQYEDGLKKYNEAYEEYQNTKDDAAAKIAQGKEDLKNLSYVLQILNNVRNALNTVPPDEAAEIARNAFEILKEYNKNLPPEDKIPQDKLNELERILGEGTTDYASAIRELNMVTDELQKKYDEGVIQIAEAEKQLSEAEGKFAAEKKKLDDSKAQLDAAQKKLNSEKTSGAAKLASAKKQIDAAKNKLAASEREYNEGKAKLEQGRKDLEEGKEKIKKAEEALEASKKDADEKFREAEKEIKLKEKELNSLSKGKWYNFTRFDNPGFQSFADDAKRIDGIASIFPLFFFIVAALVCLTTMTRMVEEQRTQIGTLKALGYSNISVIAKYFYYALFAALTGSILGAAVGLVTLPKIIFKAYKAMYMLPAFHVDFSWLVVLVALVGALLCTSTVAVFVAARELKGEPATLMRPKAPKNGKHILLEKIPFIWKRLNFTSKVTVRNIIRYKARFIMTVLGIAGCTALILAAYGLKDSISVVVPKQYGEIYTFDSMLTLKYDGQLSEMKDLKESLEKDNSFASNMFIQQTIMSGSSNKADDIEVRLFVPESQELFSEFVNLKDADNGHSVELTGDSVIITEKMAKLLGVGRGDTVRLTEDDGDYEVVVSDIVENYVYNYVYILPETYKKISGKEVVYNNIFSKLSEEGLKDQDQVAEKWLKNYNVLAVTFTSSLIDNFNDIITSLNNVVIVMIICAAALAFVVLYNLTNINVAERLREIATIKVLGFTEAESSNYVYRENIVLSVIGIAVGLIMGIFLSFFIVSTIEMDMVMFGRKIKALSFIFAGAFTLLFTLFVNISMYSRINNISMVESLKSVE